MYVIYLILQMQKLRLKFVQGHTGGKAAIGHSLSDVKISSMRYEIIN